MPSFCPTSLPAATSSPVSLALPLSFAFFGMRVTCPSPGPLTKLSLALFHLQASSGTYRCVRMWIGSDAQSLFTLRRVASCTKGDIVSKDKGTHGVVLHRYRREGLYRRAILVA